MLKYAILDVSSFADYKISVFVRYDVEEKFYYLFFTFW